MITSQLLQRLESLSPTHIYFPEFEACIPLHDVANSFKELLNMPPHQIFSKINLRRYEIRQSAGGGGELAELLFIHRT